MSGQAQTLPNAGRAVEIFTALLGVGLTVGLGLFVPGLGIVVGAAIAFMVYRCQRGMRNAFLALGVVVTLIVVLAAFAVRSSGPAQQPQKSPAVRVGP
jgi:hypothetical protein